MIATIGNAPDNTRKERRPTFTTVESRARFRHLLVTALWLTPVALSGACGADESTGDPAPTPTPSPSPTPSGDGTYAPCAADERVGTFALELADGFTAFEGRVTNAVVPANVRAVTATEGQCQLLQGRNLFCDPACGAGQTCGEDGACIAFPTAQSVGALTVTGLPVALTMMPSAVNFYSNGATTIPHPGFARGTAIGLSATGGTLPAFALGGEGVAALELDAADITIQRGSPVSLRWTASATSAAVRLRFVLDLAHHGGISASIDCDGIADTGRFDIPAALTAQLLDIGVAGFPTLSASRRSADSTTLSAGCVELDVVSKVDRVVVIPGLESCSQDEDCTGGETCQPDLTCG